MSDEDELITCACPNCGNTEICQADYVPATAYVEGFHVRADGTLDPEYSSTDVHWDGQHPADDEEPYYCDVCDAALNDKTLIRVNSWTPEVQVAGNGDAWAGNALRFATKEEAEANGKDLLSRWLLATASRAFPSPDPVNYRWEDNQLKGVNENAGADT